MAYIVAILLELPFVNTPLYTGPLVSHLGGADIAWIRRAARFDDRVLCPHEDKSARDRVL